MCVRSVRGGAVGLGWHPEPRHRPAKPTNGTRRNRLTATVATGDFMRARYAECQLGSGAPKRGADWGWIGLKFILNYLN